MISNFSINFWKSDSISTQDLDFPPKFGGKGLDVLPLCFYQSFSNNLWHLEIVSILKWCLMLTVISLLVSYL